MKNYLTYFCFSWLALSFLLMLPLDLTAQWSKSTGPHSTACRTLIEKNGVVYAGTYGGVFKSTDTAKTWTAVNNGLPDLEIGGLAFKGTTLYAGTGVNGLYSSTNNGTSWSKVGSLTINRINAIATDGTRLYVGAGGGIYISSDNGNTWTNPSSLLGEVRAIKIVGTAVYAGTFGNFLYKSIDNGNTWSVIDKLNNGLASEYVNTIENVGTSLFTGLWNKGINRSLDNGATWTQLTKYPWYVKSIVTSGSTLYATGVYEGLYWSNTNGTTWNYAGHRGYTAQQGSAYSMLLIGSKLIVGYDTVLIADTNFIQNFKPAVLNLPTNNDIGISLLPTFNYTNTTHTNFLGLQYSTSANNWSQATTVFVNTNTYTVSSPLSYNTKYYWRLLEQVWNVVDSTNQFVISDTFSFTTAAPFSLTYPNGGEILASGDSVDISWTGYFPTDTASLYYTTDGSTWNVITNNASSGQFRWKVPKVESSLCKIRYLSNDKDTSDANFTISIPKGIASSIDFGTTNVGNSVQKTSFCISTGIALLKVQEVLFQKGIDFYLKGIARNGDSTFITIVFDPKSVGFFNDNVFIITQAGDTIKTDVKGEALSTEKLTITYPNGNELLTAKDTVTIRWKGVSQNDFISLEYSDDDGATWNLISNSATGLSYLWTLPKIESDKCMVRGILGMNGNPGDVDTTFRIGSGISGWINYAVKQSDGKIICVGKFNSFNSKPSNGIVRLNSNGTFDSTFAVGAGISGLDEEAIHIALQTDGKLIVTGRFNMYNGVRANRIVRINTDGSIDPTFNSGQGFDDNVANSAIQSDGKIIVVGNFQAYFDTTLKDHSLIIRLLPDGSVDNTFIKGTGFKFLNGGLAQSALILHDKIYVAGLINQYNGANRGTPFRINSDGSLDTTYKITSGADRWLSLINFQADEKLLLVGQFNKVEDVIQNYIARLSTDGSVDWSFTSRFTSTQVGASFITYHDDKIYVSGDFLNYGTDIVNGIMRLNIDGSIDTSFHTGTGLVNPTVKALLPGNDANTILLCGSFSNYNSSNYNHIVRVFSRTAYLSADTSDALFAISIPKGISTTLDFGKIDTGTVSNKDFVITNTGKVALKLSMLQNTQGDPFSTQDTATRVIPAGKDTLIGISFIPLVVSTYADTMKWLTQAGDTIVSVMIGEGIASKPGVNANFQTNVIDICQFSDTLLTVKVTGGTTPYQFSWATKDGTPITAAEILSGGTSTDTSIRLSPSISNTYRVVVTDAKGQSDTALIDVIVKKTPSPRLFLRGSTSICEGDSTLIEVVNEVNYTDAPLWSDGSIGATLWVKSSGVFYCTIDSNGCMGRSDSVTITVKARPAVSITQIANELVSTVADDYQWLDSNGGLIAGATSQRYTPQTDGKYSVRVSLDGCTSTSTLFTYKKQDNNSTIIVFDLNFGQQVVSNIIGRNAPLRNSIKILNNGTIDRTIDSIIIANTVFDLKKNSLPRIVPPGVTVSFNTDFTPLAIGLYSDEIVVYAGTEIIKATIQGEGIALPSDGVITEIELVPNKLEVSPGDTLFVFLRIKDEQPQASKATKFIANMQYDSRVLQWLPRSRQYNDEDSKRTNYWSLNVQEKRRFQGNPRLDTLMFLVKLADVDSTSLVFSDSTAFIWTDANGKVFPACRDSIVYIKVCKDGGISQLIRFAKPDMVKQVAPNPSIGNSTITLSMGITGPCSVSLNDIFGRVIQEVNYPILTEGDHTLQFNNASLETGTYYVVMKTGFAISTQKISIVK
ncbi:MAG: T9SS type A sorting domain-containing protein [Ignavibacteria bacterium]|nr:T9SS type A sorting domain-containing protein [Ignavibacteria bacterium]